MALSMLMTERREVDEILHLAITAAPALVGCQVAGVHLVDSGWQAQPPSPRSWDLAALSRQVSALASESGPVEVPEARWAWALHLPGAEGSIGHLLVADTAEPSPAQLHLLRAMAQQTGIAISNARLHASHRATNAALEETVALLSRKNEIHDRFTRVALNLEGYPGIVRALHEVTGLPAVIEEEGGVVLAQSGLIPDLAEPAPSARARASTIRQVARAGHPIHQGGRLTTVARPRADVLGLISLVCPAEAVGAQETMALEHAATVLAIELARLHSIAETELRLGVDLVAELVSGAGEGVGSRARALGHDLGQAHRVIVLRASSGSDAPSLLPIVRAALSSAHQRALLMARADLVVAVVRAEATEEPWTRLVDSSAGTTGDLSIGVGRLCSSVEDYPASYREARLSLRLAEFTGGRDGVVTYDDLGVYQFLSEATDPRGVEAFVERWLGELIAYDRKRHSDLVGTLSRFLECGGNYDTAAARLGLGRSTVRYRIGRVAEITGHLLQDPDTRFQLQLATRAWVTLRALGEDG